MNEKRHASLLRWEPRSGNDKPQHRPYRCENIAAVDITLPPDDRTWIADAMSGARSARYAAREMAMLPQR